MSEPWLTGWHKISKYIGKSPSTVLRYVQKFALPVRHDPSGHVCAIPREIDQWLIEFDDRNKKMGVKPGRSGPAGLKPIPPPGGGVITQRLKKKRAAGKVKHRE